MKTIMTSIAASSLLAALATAQPTHYNITDLGTLRNGTVTYATGITNNGLISGHASPPDGTIHPVLWQNGQITDIGIPGLGGQNGIAWAVNERGQAVGQAETSLPEPNGEDPCGSKVLVPSPLGTTCVPFLWQNGVMTGLLTLGGNNGVANHINNRGEVAGSAENTTPDTNCPAPQVFQFKPVVWKNNGKIQALPTELPTITGDADGLAFGINENGQVVGASGSCTTFDPIGNTSLLPLHALLWGKDGSVTDLKNLGGEFGHSANAVNNLGQVVGSSDLPGDEEFHAFLWQNGVMTDLKTLPGDRHSVALHINDRGEVVGISLDATFTFLHAVLWQNGVSVPVDLNTRILANPAGLYLQLAEAINSSGEIVGFAQTSTGDTHAFLATPSNGAAASESFSPASQAVASPMVASENARKVLQQRLRFDRFGARLPGQR